MTVTSRSGDRLTPDQVRSIALPQARFGHRGYDEEHVLAFCALVEHELVTLLNEKASLWEEVERLRRRIIDAGDASGVRPEDAHVQAVRILSNAQQMADRYVADAQEYSRQITEEARRHRDEVLAEAKTQAGRVLDEVHSRASRAAEVVPAEPGPANGEWRDHTAELAYLRTFSEVYRTHLRAYLETLLNNVEDWEQSEKSSLAAARAELPFPFPSMSPPPGTAPPSAAGPPPSPYSSPSSYTSPPSYPSPSPAQLPVPPAAGGPGLRPGLAAAKNAARPAS
jgi:DivIVA domain-containing protein